MCAAKFASFNNKKFLIIIYVCKLQQSLGATHGVAFRIFLLILI
jgi:hypothetical protein